MKTMIRFLALVVAASLATACEPPPNEVVQTGFRGLGFEHVKNPDVLEDSVTAILARVPTSPVYPPLAVGESEPLAAGTYENVQVLGHLSLAEFTFTMQALTQWVSPDSLRAQGQGCNYCHVVGPDSVNYASDGIYTKVVSRRMLQMVQDLNTNYPEHVAETGVNCWTCHQGKPLPTNFWFFTDENQTLRHYLDRDDLRVQGPYALTSQGKNRRSIRQAEYAYSLMMTMSNGMGVNCTYCHNSARFADWEESSPQRVTALRGLRMVRDLNQEYMVSLQDEWPDNRLGPLGDGPKIQCATCHQAAYQPQYNHPASHATGWRAITEIGYPNPPAPAENADQGG